MANEVPRCHLSSVSIIDNLLDLLTRKNFQNLREEIVSF